MDGWRSSCEEGVFTLWSGCANSIPDRQWAGSGALPQAWSTQGEAGPGGSIRRGHECQAAVQGEAVPGSRKTMDTSLQVCPEKTAVLWPTRWPRARKIREKRPVPAWTPGAVSVCTVWAYGHAADCSETQP